MAGSSAERGPRIVTGRFRGRRLRVPHGKVTRPARARVRRSVFDILQRSFEDTRWLDLYAGSGSFGIEALSRGASHTTFVEAGRAGAICLQKNLDDLGLDDEESVVLRRRLPGVFRSPPPAGLPYRFISMDPPFAISRDANSLRELCDGLGDAGHNGWFEAGSLLIWEEPSDAAAPTPGGFEETDRRPFGTSRVRFFQYVGDAEA